MSSDTFWKNELMRFCSIGARSFGDDPTSDTNRTFRVPLPQWPQIQLLSEGDQIRSRYIEAMKTADQEDYRQLIAFMKALVE